MMVGNKNMQDKDMCKKKNPCMHVKTAHVNTLLAQ